MKFTFIHWILIFGSGILALACLFIAMKLFNIKYPITKRDQFNRSLKIGGLLAIFSLIVVFVIGIFIWAVPGDRLGEIGGGFDVVFAGHLRPPDVRPGGAFVGGNVYRHRVGLGPAESAGADGH